MTLSGQASDWTDANRRETTRAISPIDLAPPRKVLRVKSVSVLAVRPMINGFERLGVPRPVSLQVAGLSEKKLTDPDARVSPKQVWLLWLKALEVTGDPCLGLHLAETVEPSDYGVIGYIVLSSATVRDALIRVDRYHGLLADAVHYTVEEIDDAFVLRHEIAGGGGVPGAMAAYVLAVPHLLMQHAFDHRPRLREVRITCERPTDASEYERIFDAPVRFSADENSMTIPAILDASMPTSDPALISVLEGYAESLLDSLPPSESLSASVYALVRRTLRDGTPDVEALSRRLALSTRTLRRRLREEGTSVSEIVTDTRHQLALKYLGSGDIAASEIAYLLGFSDPTAFHRAFKRWQGCTPLEHRRRARGFLA